jgi:hypothetical protein
MYTGSLGAVSNNEDWTVNISMLADDNSLFNMTGAIFTFYVTDPDTPKRPILSVTDGTLTISADGFTTTLVFPYTKMNVLCAGDYAVFVRCFLNGVMLQFISAGVSIVEGGPS